MQSSDDNVRRKTSISCTREEHEMVNALLAVIRAGGELKQEYKKMLERDDRILPFYRTGEFKLQVLRDIEELDMEE